MIACCEAVVVVWVGSGLGGHPRRPANFFLPCLAAGASSPLPSSLTPGQLLQRSFRSTSSHSLFTFPYPSHNSTLPSLFLHIPSRFPRLPHGTPHSLTMPAPPPQSLPCSARSCSRSNSSLAFVPSSQVFLLDNQNNIQRKNCLRASSDRRTNEVLDGQVVRSPLGQLNKIEHSSRFTAVDCKHGIDLPGDASLPQPD